MSHKENNNKKRRKVITLVEKLEIIKRYESGYSKAKIMRELGYNESTIRTILKRSKEYKKKGKVTAASIGMQMTRNRSLLKIEMERLVTVWIEDCNQKGLQLSVKMIQAKAKDTFDSLKRSIFPEETEIFYASKGWFEKFKNRTTVLRNLKISKDNEDKIENAPFQNLSSEDVINLIDLHSGQLTDDCKQMKHEELEKSISAEDMEQVFNSIECAKDILRNSDPNKERSNKCCRSLDKAINNYRKLYKKISN